MKFSITNLILLVTITALAIALVTTLLSKDPVIIVREAESNFSFEFRQSMMKASPRWLESEKNPPLSVRNAIKIADKIGEKLEAESKPFDIGKWYFDSISLTHLNFGYRDLRTKNSSTKWCYVVHLKSLRSKETASFVILMDETVIMGENNWTSPVLMQRMKKHYPPIPPEDG